MLKALVQFAAIGALATVFSAYACAQQPEAVGDNVLRLDGTDHDSGIHYLKLILLLRPPDAPENASADSLPRFTVECRQDSGKRSLHWLLRFDGSPDFAFQPPQRSTLQDPNPVPYPTVSLKMRFEGYMRSEEFKRQWEILPTGELHYRNPGFSSSNLDDPRHFMQWLNSLPNLRIGYAKPSAGKGGELVFQTKPLLDLVKKSDLCQP